MFLKAVGLNITYIPTSATFTKQITYLLGKEELIALPVLKRL